MARCRPMFPSFGSSPAPANMLPSSLSTSATQPQQRINTIQQVELAHAILEALPDELSPPSRPPSPMSQSRVARLCDKIAEAVAEAGSPANPNWAHVSSMLHMACTSRIYRGVPQGVRVGESAKAEVGNYEWVLPDTAEEWELCERKWERRLLNTSNGEGQQSKYWPPKVVESRLPEEVIVERTPSKAELVREKVRAWQATMISTTEEEDVGVSETKIPALAKATEPQDIVQKDAVPRMKQSPISFPVAKTSVATAGKRVAKGRGSSLPLADVVPSPSPNNEIESVIIPDIPSSNPNVAQIAEMSEMSFLPPSFPPQLETSTPPLADKSKGVVKPRAKPSPILPLRGAGSSPSSSPRLPNSTLDRIPPPLPSSSSPPSSSQRLPTAKHTRPLTPPADNSSIVISPEHPVKKPRMDSDDSPIRESSAPPPPSTPPPITSPRTPSSPLIRKGLGNAKGIRIPTTPTNKVLPTLTELLASTRRSRPRPRPPSRKTKPTASLFAVSNEEGAQPPPAGTEREPSPAPTAFSRAKTVFSSPASGSSDSPDSLRERPRSPISPLFSKTFAPPFASTQQHGPDAGGFGGMAASSQAQGVGLTRGGSGMAGMGYNSQFDLEGQIGEVSDLLERDVDFDGWLRDIPEVDAEG